MLQKLEVMRRGEYTCRTLKMHLELRDQQLKTVLYMYVCVCVCTYIYIYTRTHTLYKCAHTHMYMCVCIYIERDCYIKTLTANKKI